MPLPDPLPTSAPCPNCWWEGEESKTMLQTRDEEDDDPVYLCLACGYELTADGLWGDGRWSRSE